MKEAETNPGQTKVRIQKKCKQYTELKKNLEYYNGHPKEKKKRKYYIYKQEQNIAKMQYLRKHN